MVKEFIQWQEGKVIIRVNTKKEKNTGQAKW
jgi:hypothetical protein